MIDLADIVEGLVVVAIGLIIVGRQWASPTLLWLAIGAAMLAVTAAEKRTGWLSELAES